jgi:hypothetical protein
MSAGKTHSNEARHILGMTKGNTKGNENWSQTVKVEKPGMIWCTSSAHM